MLTLRRVDFVLWTRTGWDWNRILGADGQQKARNMQLAFLELARMVGRPVVGYHLDIWFGLGRQHQLDEPFFKCDVMVTADGGHPDEFRDLGINHVWFPPAISRGEAEVGMFRDEFHSKIAFVGNWQGDYHKEHQHRHDLVAWLQKNYPNDCAFWPKRGQHAVRGKDLQDLYASVDVVVGDSCFAGTGLANYWSDRIPETLGRGGYLLHPDVPGLHDHYPVPIGPSTWEAGDWDHLGFMIESSLALPIGQRKAITRLNRDWVVANDTYEVRMEQLVELLSERNLL